MLMNISTSVNSHDEDAESEACGTLDETRANAQ